MASQKALMYMYVFHYGTAPKESSYPPAAPGSSHTRLRLTRCLPRIPMSLCRKWQVCKSHSNVDVLRIAILLTLLEHLDTLAYTVLTLLSVPFHAHSLCGWMLIWLSSPPCL